jgi:hypothetical protein
MDIEAVAHDTPEKIIAVDIDPTTGVTAADVGGINALKLEGDAAKDGQARFPIALQGVHRNRHEPARGEPADRHDRTVTCACSTPRSASTTTPRSATKS